MENALKEENISKNSLNLDNLPVDVLICIFRFCNLTELGRLSRVCKRFKHVIADEFLWRNRCKTLITNQTSSEILSRSSKLLKPKEKCRIATNWRAGFYCEETYSFKSKYIPWLLLESDRLWLSKGSSIYVLKRTNNGVLMTKPLFSLENGHTEDIRRFIRAHDLIFSCGQDGRICGWSAKTGKLMFRRSNCHDSNILCIDIYQQTIVTGSKDTSVKIWRLREDLTWCDPLLCIIVDDRTWCTAIDPTGSRIACGSSGHSGIPPLHFYDLESGLETTVLDCYTFKRGAAIFDMKWESPSILITSGYDSFIRMFDLRVGGCVGMWMDPFDAAGYCLATDKLYSILCGTSQYGRVQLWDKRMSRSIQAYFGKGVASSPVYSLSFDPCQLFIAQDLALNVLDFSGYLHETSIRYDYRSYWSKNNLIM